MATGMDNPSYFLSDGDKIRPKTDADYNFGRGSSRSGSFTRWMKKNWLKISIASGIIIFLILLLSIVLYYSLRSFPKKPHCHKFYEAKVVVIEFELEFRLSKPPQTVIQHEMQYILENFLNQNRTYPRCNCTPLSAFWRWWDVHLSHLNGLMGKFELIDNPACKLRNTSSDIASIKDSSFCTAVVLTAYVNNCLRELAFLTSDTGFLVLFVNKDESRRYEFGKSLNQENVFDKTINDADVLEKINSFFRFVDSCAGDLKINYTRIFNYTNQLSNINDKIVRAERSHFLPYSEDKHYIALSELMTDEKMANDYLTAYKQLKIFSNLPNETSWDNSLRIDSYNEAVLGISNENLARNYEKLLHQEISKKGILIAKALEKLSSMNEDIMSYEACLKLRMGECEPSENWEQYLLTVYNPSDHKRNIFVRVPVTLGEYLVQTAEGKSLPVEIKTVPESVMHLKRRKFKEHRIFEPILSNWELIFQADNVPGYGFKSFFVSRPYSNQFESKQHQENVRLVINPETKALTGVKVHLSEFSLESNLMLYESYFCGGILSRFKALEKVANHGTEVKKGELLTEFEYVYEGLGSKIVRTYKDEDYFEVEWIFHNFTFTGEVVIQYNTKIDSKGIFYTGGYETELEERKNNRPHCSKTCLISENCAIKYYYPVQRVLIKDEDKQMHILSETPQSVTSPCSGVIEFSMLLTPTNDSVISQKHWIFIGKASDLSFRQKTEGFSLQHRAEPLLFFSNSEAFTNPVDDLRLRLVTKFSGLTPELPRNTFIITFEPKKENIIWLRLKNVGLYPEKIDFSSLFPKFETEPIEIKFGSSDCSPKKPYWDPNLCLENLDHQWINGVFASKILINPTDIRSFLIKIKPKN